MRIIARITIYGLEYLPPNDTGYIAVANHIGRLDAALSFFILDRKDIIILMAEKYREHAWSRFFTRAVNGIYIDRYHADLNATRELLRRINAGGVATLSPEGTRSTNCSLNYGRDGASYMAAKTGRTILPVGVTGSGDAEVADRLKHFRRLNIVIHVGPTFTLPALDNKKRNEQLAIFTEEIMCRIAALLPISYRGVYTGRTRVDELVAENAKHAYLPPKIYG